MERLPGEQVRPLRREVARAGVAAGGIASATAGSPKRADAFSWLNSVA